MSKKKTLSTMSLKDFHGGSIPSDLPLPSAPGIVVRSGSDRTAPPSLGSNFARSDLRPRPKSSGAGHGFDEKASFLSHPAPIGRNFDEDERKPLDGLSAPRRTISDESIRSSASVRQEAKPSYVSSTRDGPVSSPVTQPPGLGSVRFGGGGGSGSGSLASNDGQFVLNLKNSGGNNVQGLNNSAGNNPPNAWRVRREVGGVGDGGGSSVSMGMDNASKLAQASALDKVSSGMWQLKSPSQLLPQLVHSKGNGGASGVDERVDYGALHGSQGESDQILVDGNQGREWISREQFQTQMRKEEVWSGVISVGSQLRPTTSPEVSERPTEKFLPRSKTLENSENHYRQVPESGQIIAPNEFRGSANPPNSGPTDVITGGQPIEKVERPRLNLKPRSQPLDQPDGSLQREKNSLFGGARPRELVLKERGVDDAGINNLDVVSPGRAISSKKEGTSEQLVSPARNNPKFESRTSNRRFWMDSERKDQQMDNDKTEVERRNWRNDKWRSNKDTKDQRPEPETWRKPIEEPKPAATDASGFRQGKLVSALELAQAFSKPVSDPKTTDLHSSQRAMAGRNNQVPFSRLTAPTAVHRINGGIEATAFLQADEIAKTPKKEGRIVTVIHFIEQIAIVLLPLRFYFPPEGFFFSVGPFLYNLELLVQKLN